MSAVEHVESSPRVAVVRFDRLLALYWVVPIALAMVGIDLALGGKLRRALPHHPDDLAFFTLFFNLPHIVASHLIFADSEYVAKYRRHLVGFAIALLVVTAALYLSAPILLVAGSLLFTYFHVISQQVGLTGAQLRTSDWSFPAWKWSSIVVGIAAYASSIEPAVRGHQLRVRFAAYAWLLVLPTFYFAVRLHRLAKSAGARRYLWANQIMITGMLAFGALGYPFFTVLMPRIIHDLTAFYVYGVHDHNRHASGSGRNWLYRVGHGFGLPTWVFGPLLAIAITFVVQSALPRMASLWAVYFLSAFHYYLEGVVWKRGTPHRAFASFE